MNQKELGAQPAAPSSESSLDPRCIGWVGGGLTKRELFAAIAMHACAVNGLGPEESAENGAYWADALLSELAKDQP